MPEAIAAYHPDFFPFLIGETMTETTSPATTTDELDAARDALAAALDAVAEAERVHSAKQAEARTQEALVATLREAVTSGDLTAADRARSEAVVARELAEEAHDLRRVVLARRGGVRAAEARLIVAEAAAGVGAYADDAEVREQSAGLALELVKALVPVLRKVRERDRAVDSATERLKAHVREVPGLSMLGNPERPDGFIYRGRRFGVSGEFDLKFLVGRVWSDALAEVRRDAGEEPVQG